MTSPEWKQSLKNSLHIGNYIQWQAEDLKKRVKLEITGTRSLLNHQPPNKRSVSCYVKRNKK